MLRSLSSKLIFSLVIIVLVVKTIALWVNLSTQEAQLLQSMTSGADQLSRSITSATWHAMLSDQRTSAYQVMNTIAEKQGVERIRMFNKDGTLMFSTVANEELRIDESAEVCTPCHAHTPPRVNVELPSRTRVFRGDDGRRTMTMITPIYNEPSCSEASCHAHPASLSVLGVLDLRLDASQVDEEMRAIRLRTALLTVVEIGLIWAFLVFFTSRFVEKPILKLIAGTRAISEMQLDQPVTIKSSEELSELAHSFEVMRLRLKQSMEENAEFTQQLESKVEQRTAQLRVAQHKLMQRILKDDGIPPGRIPDFRRYLGQVASETSRVGRIVSDLLSFSRRSKPQSTQADLNALIRTTVSLVNHKLQLANVAVELDLASPLPAVCCDSSQIQQVIMNLVMNGAEAIHGGGSVAVSTRASDDGRSVVLDVRDTGAGMAPEVVDRIFDPFFTTKEEGKGVGLGLAVVYGIVEAHGGEIEVESAPGKGTTFRVTLPLAPPSNGSSNEKS